MFLHFSSITIKQKIGAETGAFDSAIYLFLCGAGKFPRAPRRLVLVWVRTYARVPLFRICQVKQGTQQVNIYVYDVSANFAGPRFARF
jgi:hypothetical protein